VAQQHVCRKMQVDNLVHVTCLSTLGSQKLVQSQAATVVGCYSTLGEKLCHCSSQASN
jgi:hypothetical protein